MAIIPWRPLFDLDRFWEDEDWLLPVIPKEKLFPAMDLYETDKAVIAEVNAPGIDPKQIEVSVENGMLRVAGKGEKKREEKKKNYWRREISRSSFERIVRLPVAVDENKVKATYEKGILKIEMPKKAVSKSKAKKIKINVVK